MEDDAKAKQQYEAALEASERRCRDRESSLSAAVQENAAIRRELEQLKSELAELRLGRCEEVCTDV